jgi:hypothetical protein
MRPHKTRMKAARAVVAAGRTAGGTEASQPRNRALESMGVSVEMPA